MISRSFNRKYGLSIGLRNHLIRSGTLFGILLISSTRGAFNRKAGPSMGRFAGKASRNMICTKLGCEKQKLSGFAIDFKKFVKLWS